ncbi:inositol oxygenase family protein [Terriglobus saanensis]|uniref:Inositol oxygenase n=1 Tax=Terriglobus saanensis (strain ATCC BAA-1853 / DSM 23119 / SP1PR4) TaxID=401053 RepID=E8V707_TERSS|nr:inositol oxygenase family protein [Terriglobus saanensis]ADV81647.1 Inositol oxygenase [Terriglobus saanensis SP1PR4]
MSTATAITEQNPLGDIDQWDEFLAGRYQEGKSETEFRQYDAEANPGVAEFYRLNHQYQTHEYVLGKEKEYFGLTRGKKTIWEAAEFLNTLVDDSDPDTDLTQIEHLLQTSEAMRRDKQPRWMILTGFVHDLGKCLCLYGEPQWGVVGDTFPTGCAYSKDIVFPEYFAANPDSKNPLYQTKYGIYEPNCGLDKVHMSFGHDGYIYEVMKNYLPIESLYMLRYHSFYSWHRHGAYDHLCNEQDREMLQWVNKFNPYDLYSKGHTKPNMAELKPYYDELFAEFFPEKIDW